MSFDLLHATCHSLRDRTICEIRKEATAAIAPFKSDLESVRAYYSTTGWVDGDITDTFLRKVPRAQLMGCKEGHVKHYLAQYLHHFLNHL